MVDVQTLEAGVLASPSPAGKSPISLKGYKTLAAEDGDTGQAAGDKGGCSAQLFQEGIDPQYCSIKCVYFDSAINMHLQKEYSQ